VKYQCALLGLSWTAEEVVRLYRSLMLPRPTEDALLSVAIEVGER